ncbi:DUF4905 domain-containing protein [Pontibacter ruber]|uniref:DUF4905 domain-containing protein n=1 Tax=Pontibacter ruber TaxID=1343895 RepID=A0ABW5CUN0_9BACT|nr:DUF4905 domain-containing protein [Pontibacter ruber]
MWRIRLDTLAGRLAVEVRDADLLIASFYTFDCQAHALQELKLPGQLTWWQGLEDAHKNLLFIHGYGDRKVGQHKGITALAAETGAVQWQEPDLTFYGVIAEGVLAYPAATPESGFILLQTQSGAVLQQNITQQEAVEKVNNYNIARYNACTYPMLYLEGEVYFLEVSRFLAEQGAGEALKAIEYAETEQFMIISYYCLADEDKLDNFVAVFDLEGDLHLKEKVAGNLHGIGSDTFFIFKHELYFVQNSDTLQVYNLTL